MGEMNWWGVNPEQTKTESQPAYSAGGEIEKVESIHESDRVRARVAVMRGESELYFIKIPPDINKLETRPAGGNVYEVVYHDIVYGYTNNPNTFSSGQNEAAEPETYN